MFKKPIIVFEGIEASGKSTKLNIVSNYLRKKKIPFVKFREPGGSKNSEKIRKLILNKKADFNNITDLFLYFASIIAATNLETPIPYDPILTATFEPFCKSTLQFNGFEYLSPK